MRITSTQNFRAGRICAVQGTSRISHRGHPVDGHSANVATRLRHESLQLHIVGLQLLCHVVDLRAQRQAYAGLLLAYMPVVINVRITTDQRLTGCRRSCQSGAPTPPRDSGSQASLSSCQFQR